MDETDRRLLALLQADATRAYAALAKEVGLSAGAVHERVRKLRERGVIRRTTVDVDPAAVGRGVLAFVLIESTAWMGDSSADFAAIPEIQEAHVIAGNASVLVKVRTGSTEELQDVLRRLYAIDGVGGTQATVALETFFERPLLPTTGAPPGTTAGTTPDAADESPLG
ncbi:Lrp/AsnC family transcriptional regulator [Embleya sp. NBC_00896]|uniref:Lrp/AsnC family transcriptional regulator n=1 Tax=Embleya sp. NBC_00896 TaxID=2975961 RepID=UPI002F90EE5A|nr:Lrp/AsnC family transcriptional regulator [Embleya sp. NBC_00896]